MTTPAAIWTLDTQHLGRRVHLYECLDSTNSLALSLGNDPTQHGFVVLTREQTAGRGQYGRSWQAPPGSSVLLSALIFPPLHLRRPVLLTAWAAVAVCETVRKLAHLPTTIKWPNDVLVHGGLAPPRRGGVREKPHKICGILIEQRTTGHADFPLATVVGIGLNISQSAEMFAEAGLPHAASLASQSGLSFRFDDVAKELIHQLDERYDQLVNGALGALEMLWQDRLSLLGKHVIVETVHEFVQGRLLDVTFTGIAVEGADGDVTRLLPEAVRGLRLAFA